MSIPFSEHLHDLAQPYFFKTTERKENSLVILTHGFGASCTETRPLATFLQTKGFDVYGVLLNGHGSTPSSLDNVSWKEWVRNIEEIYNAHKSSYKNIFLGGVSLGGALSLYVSTYTAITGVFTINGFYKLKLPFFKRLLLPFLALFKSHLPRSEVRRQWYLDNNLYAYPDDAVFGIYQITRLQKALHKSILKISSPALIIQSQNDKTIDPQNGQWIYSALKCKKELLLIPEGDHIFTVDPNHMLAFEPIAKFLVDLTEQ